LPDVAKVCGASPDRKIDPIQPSAIDDPHAAAVCRLKRRLGARKGHEKGNAKSG
jgi:hypothetical protein